MHLSIHVISIYLTIFLTSTKYHSRSQGPTISSVNQCIPHILWNPKVHHTFRHIPLLVLILSRLNPVDVNARHSFQTHFIKCVCTSGHFLLGIRTKDPGHYSFHTTHDTCSAHLTIIGAVQYHLVFPIVQRQLLLFWWCLRLKFNTTSVTCY